MLEYRARGSAYPKGAPSVYLIYCREDEADADAVTSDLLAVSELAVWRDAEGDTPESELAEMELAVAVVTPRLLSDESGRIARELKYFKEGKIPVLPILTAPCSPAEYERMFGSVQYLDRLDSDLTAIKYTDKLTGYLKSLFLSDEMTERIRAEFDTYLFLSYRKLDRAAAHRLMQRIHSIDGLYDVAIWYDEFLRPAAEFDLELENQIEKADGFVMAITPRLLEEGNYVLREEYPLARRIGKPVVAALAGPTDREKFRNTFSELTLTEEGELAEALYAALGDKINPNNDDSLLHNYLMGLAYVHGIEVETDRERGIELLRRAAEGGFSLAYLRLSELYTAGLGVERDLGQARELMDKAMDAALSEIEARAELPVYINAWQVACAWIKFHTLYEIFDIKHDSGIGLEIVKAMSERFDIESDYASLVLKYSMLRAEFHNVMGDPMGLYLACNEVTSCFPMMPHTERPLEERLMLWMLGSYRIDALRILDRDENGTEGAAVSAEEIDELIAMLNEGSNTSLISDAVKVIKQSVRLICDPERQLMTSRKLVDLIAELYSRTGSPSDGVSLVDEICALARLVCLNCEPHEAERLIDEAEAIAEKLEDRAKESCRSSILFARATVCEYEGELDRATTLREEDFALTYKRYTEGGGFLLASQLAVKAEVLSLNYRNAGEEVNSRLWLAEALKYATEAVETNPSSEAYRRLSEIYDMVAEIPTCRGEKWRQARKFNAERHTAYTVNSASRRADYNKEIKPHLQRLLIGLALLCAGALILLTAYLAPIGVNWISGGLAIVGLIVSIVGLNPASESLIEYLDAKLSAQARFETEIGERREIDGLSRRLTELYRWERRLPIFAAIGKFIITLLAVIGGILVARDRVTLGILLAVIGIVICLLLEIPKNIVENKTNRIFVDIARL